MRKGSTSPRFREERNKVFYELFVEGNLTLGEIARNPEYNPTGISKQRIHKIIQGYPERMARLNELPTGE